MEKIGAYAEADRVTADGEWQAGNPATGQKATPMLSAYFNMLQRELLAVLSAGGVAPDVNIEDQLAEAIQRLTARNVTTVTGVSGGTTQALTIAEAGLVLVDATNGAVTLDLPAASDNGGLRYDLVRIDNSANAVSVTPGGTDTIDGAASLDIAVADRRTLVCDGTSVWRRPEPVASESQPGMAEFATPTEAANYLNDMLALSPSSLIAGVLGAGGAGTSDYIALPFRDKTTGELRHLIVQWGSEISSSSGPVTAYFPIAFPSACLRVVITSIGGGAGRASISGGQTQETASSFSLNTYDHAGARAPVTSGYIAIGI